MEFDRLEAKAPNCLHSACYVTRMLQSQPNIYFFICGRSGLPASSWLRHSLQPHLGQLGFNILFLLTDNSMTHFNKFILYSTKNIYRFTSSEPAAYVSTVRSNSFIHIGLFTLRNITQQLVNIDSIPVKREQRIVQICPGQYELHELTISTFCPSL